ncbi:MAG TPA: hypothetical protein VE780_04600 [Thermoleophilaceae bacterium]|nr:hypothetical protein [Thermoleophilaceae bacterium]
MATARATAGERDARSWLALIAVAGRLANMFKRVRVYIAGARIRAGHVAPRSAPASSKGG